MQVNGVSFSYLVYSIVVYVVQLVVSITVIKSVNLWVDMDLYQNPSENQPFDFPPPPPLCSPVLFALVWACY